MNRFWTMIRSILYFFAGLARIQCRQPRMTEGAARMTPLVVRETLENIHCERWHFHPGRHEMKLESGSVERW